MPAVIEQMPGEGRQAGVVHRGLGAVPIDFRHLWGLGTNSLVVAILSPFIALSAGRMPRILLGVVILDIPLQLGVELFYRPTAGAYGAQGGLSFSITTMALAGLYASWFLGALTNRDRETRASVHINLALTLYLAFATLSLFVAEDVGLSLFELCLLLQTYFVYFYVANFTRTREDVRFVVSLLLIGCLLESLIVIGLKFGGIPSALAWLERSHIRVDTDLKEGFTRIGGTVGSPNGAGSYFSLLLAPAAGALLAKLGRGSKWLATAVLTLGGVALIFTFSRGAWIAFGLSIAMLCFLAFCRPGLSLTVPVAVIVVLALVYLPFQSDISARLFGDDRGAAGSRISFMKPALRAIEDNPVLGVGSNNLPIVMDRYLTADFRKLYIYVVHNKYLLVWAETGLGALLALLAFLLGTLREGWRCWKLNDPLLSPLALGFTAAIAGHMVHMGGDVFRGRPVLQLLWLIAALLVAMHRICRRSTSCNPVSCTT